MNFTKSLIQWYLNNKRDLPWRDTQDPYLIWMSEIMLQQTRVAQVIPYFFNFTVAFPTVFDLANASEEQVLKLWQGLGYYSRARNMHKTAQYIAFERDGIFPDNYSDLLKLKGVGEYTAAAIASFSYDEVVPVVDGNVFRVLSRYFDVESDIILNKTKKKFQNLALELISKDNSAIFNQAIMEFGALQCVPKNPNCHNCVMNGSCAALQKKKVDKLPIKSKKMKVKDRFFNYIIFSDSDENTIVQKRIAKGIWHNLYEFPLFETIKEEANEDIKVQIFDNYSNQFTIESIILYNEKSTIHKLSHQHLYIKFWKIEVVGKIKGGIDYNLLMTFPFPIVLFDFIVKEWSNRLKKNVYLGEQKYIKYEWHIK